MRAEIISIGTEILLGDIVNTNAQFLAKELASLGIDVYNQSVIGDNEGRLLEAFDDSFKRCDLIITTGGLGPTQDDVTKEVAAKYFNKELIFNEEALDWIKKYINIKDDILLNSNKKQAYFPQGSIILHNPNGTAKGCIIHEDNKILIILPGPPREMKPMFNDYVIQYLKKLTKHTISSKIIRLFGIPESLMAQKLNDIITNSFNPTVAPYAKENDVIIRITAKGKDESECLEIINPMKNKIKDILCEYIYGEDEDSLEFVVAKLLCKKSLTISTVESCTGGMVAQSLISYPGISEVFKEGVVTYSNEAKVKRANVKEETLKRYGAVSFETAKEMAEGIAKEAQTDIAISTTGIAGPGGGTDEKPVGLVYVGIFINGRTIVKKFNFTGDRSKVRIKTTLNALNMLREELLKL